MLTYNIFNFYKTSQKRKILLKKVRGIKKTEGIFLRKKWELFEDERLQEMVRKKELEVILQKMIEANAVLLEWSDKLWLILIDECVAHVDKTNLKMATKLFNNIKNQSLWLIFLLLLRIQINDFIVEY